jgi:hypothetical protein
MAKALKKGDMVEWGTSQGKTTGTVEKKITGTKKIKGYTATASEDEPQFLVKSKKTGAKAAHKAESLKKVSKPAAKSATKPAKKSAAKKK